MRRTAPGPFSSRRRFLQISGGWLALNWCAGCASSGGRARTAARLDPDPAETGKRVADHVAASQLNNVEYPTVCCAYGVLRFARTAGAPALAQRVEAAFADCLSGAKAPDRYQNGRKLEHRWFGIVPLELGVARDSRYALVARREADLVEAEPVKDGPLFYVDLMYGVGTLQAKAFLHLGDPRYAARCLSHLLVHCEALQRPDGLFHHSERGRQAWARGNGWAAASMTEALLALPADYPRREELFGAWRRLMAALVRHQVPEGLWRQIVDLPGSWLETSGAAMFVFALATGIRKGWLPAASHLPAVARGWRALANSVDDQGRVANVCIGLGDDPGTEAHYLSCPRKAGDKHGQAPFLWAASAIQELRGA